MIRASIKIVLIVLWIALCALVAKIFLLCGWREWRDAAVQQCYKGIALIMGLEVHLQGQLSTRKPLLLVSNHCSYLDIVALGAAVRGVRFTPKSEIAKWPGVGAMCRLSDCVFIDRRIHKTHDNRSDLTRAFSNEQIVSLFPEGTTNDGKHLLPFRSSYFSICNQTFHDAPLAVQPLTISYTHVNNFRITNRDMPRIAWYGDMDLLPHVMELLNIGKIRVNLIFHEILGGQILENRKELAKEAEKIVGDHLR